MEMRCYCKILHISYKGHVTNKEVHAKIQQAIGPHKEFAKSQKAVENRGKWRKLVVKSSVAPQ